MDSTTSTDTTGAAPEAPQYVRSAAAVATSTGDDYRVDIRSGRHLLAADEPASVGGGDTATTPIGLLLSALGSCTAITLRMYAQRKGWPLETVRVHLAYEKGPENSARITRRIDLVGDLDDTRRARLLDIAERTPVTRAVGGGTPVVPAERLALADRVPKTSGGRPSGMSSSGTSSTGTPSTGTPSTDSDPKEHAGHE